MWERDGGLRPRERSERMECYKNKSGMKILAACLERDIAMKWSFPVFMRGGKGGVHGVAQKS